MRGKEFVGEDGKEEMKGQHEERKSEEEYSNYAKKLHLEAYSNSLY